MLKCKFKYNVSETIAFQNFPEELPIQQIFKKDNTPNVLEAFLDYVKIIIQQDIIDNGINIDRLGYVSYYSYSCSFYVTYT